MISDQHVQNICKEAELDSISMVDTGSLSFSPTPEGEKWKVLLIKECIEIKSGRLESNLTMKEINHIIDTVSV